ncbi:MAG: hypothetical protein KDG55_07420 [Rhodocyclaceae bacterium]|nr:hypothetical protein [Rhodocyclaceae bacterium]
MGTAHGQVTNRTDTEFLNRDSIAFTRHNLTQRQPGAAPNSPNGSLMDPFRNNYGEVCVYCHTPHGANASVQLPLWNRTIKAGTTYQTYDQLGTSTITQSISRPGVNSLSCLSCHDGTTAVDSIINMPGSGGYSAAMQTTNDDGVINAFLATWGPGVGDTFEHMKLNESTGSGSCLSCHSPDGIAAAQNFTVFAIGTDLRNDHPVGITFPTTNPDFNVTNGTTPRGDAFFDLDGDNRMDKNEVRLYDTGDGPEVECASCHDPHGVASGGAGTNFNPTFLRVSNVGSGLCMTCHVK